MYSWHFHARFVKIIYLVNSYRLTAHIADEKLNIYISLCGISSKKSEIQNGNKNLIDLRMIISGAFLNVH